MVSASLALTGRWLELATLLALPVGGGASAWLAGSPLLPGRDGHGAG